MIYLTCRHTVDSIDESYLVMLKRFDREDKKAISYSWVCSTCRDIYKETEDTFDNETDALNWLNENEVRTTYE